MVCLNQKLTEVGERPASVGQPEFQRFTFGQTPNDFLLLVCDARWGAATRERFETAQSLMFKSVQVCIDGIDVHLECLRDFNRIQAFGIQ